MTRIEFLGTGTSHGVPVIGCHCPVCSSADPHDKRWRSSVLIEKDGTTVVIDTGYEFRLQALRAGIDRLDAVLYTHQHSDHLMGLDDLRVFTSEEKLPVYGLGPVLDSISRIFPYAFDDMPYKGVPRLAKRPVEERVPFRVGSLEFTAIPVMHGCMRIAGYRFGGNAYITDASDILLDENRKYIIQESCEGAIALAPSGTSGFGYDPVFWIKEAGVISAELPEGEKDRYSHRGKAARLMAMLLEKEENRK